MAMQATHLRFAIEFENTLGIENKDEYYAGVLYPDSRYITGVNRKNTHKIEINFQSIFDNSDFDKGWKFHILYDELQKIFLLNIFEIKTIDISNREEWYKISAAKLIEDIESWKILGNDANILKSINTTQQPNNEDKEKLDFWYKLQQSVYTSNNPSFKSYKPIFDWYSEYNPKDGDGWKNQYFEQDKNKKLKEEILGIYNKVVKITNEKFKSKSGS